MNGSTLDISGLEAGYGGRSVLRDISLTIPSGQRIALIGSNGCGKSTLLKTIVGGIPKSRGTIHLNNEDISLLETDSIIDRGIAYLRQTRNIFPSLTVADNLEIASMNGGGRTPKSIDLVMSAFPVLRERESIRAGLMSGGERQALAVAMVLMHEVSLLLLDEPLAGLSRKSAGELLIGIDRLQRNERFATIIVEHRLKLIRPSVDRVVIMSRGKIAIDKQDPGLLEDKSELEKHFLA